ncbi:MAG TPA: polysaccharide deacetylase family protein [Candidatus Avalokitesvara rifleensis]|uniref:polysaccharide deacetylase family protein n=1 Tax=Candidatus Avalokitesvara rifleensis TaxID=3367620 RepID=UPI0027140ACB|nr:polysaccharide deacetylase family protein [Candidatus Brocadiales bacterium]
MREGQLFVAFSLDVDPDSNKAVKGRVDSLSYPPEKGLVRVDAAYRGLKETLQLLEYLDIPATLFFEARTAQLLAKEGPEDITSLTNGHEIGCHSHRHEDFLGAASGIPISKAQAREIICESIDILNDIFHKKIIGFRAPYLRINRELLSLLGELGFTYDSSIINDCIRPFYMNTARLWEFAVASLRTDSGRRITSYLHPLFQGKIDTEEYVWGVGSQVQRIRGGLFILAFHPWELFIDHSGKALNAENSRQRLEKLTDVLQGLKATSGLEFVRMEQYLEMHNSGKSGHPQIHEVRA